MLFMLITCVFIC